MRRKSSPSARLSARTSSVLAVPGTPSSSTWPRARSAATDSRIAAACPSTTRFERADETVRPRRRDRPLRRGERGSFGRHVGFSSSQRVSTSLAASRTSSALAGRPAMAVSRVERRARLAAFGPTRPSATATPPAALLAAPASADSRAAVPARSAAPPRRAHARRRARWPARARARAATGGGAR